MIDRTEFLDVIFGEIEDGENVCVSEGKPKEGGGMWFANHLEGDRVWRRWEPEKKARAWYYNCCTVDGGLNAKGTMVSRGRKNLLRYHVLVLDDIGQKTDAPDVEPTYKLESSPGSFQWGYGLLPGDDLDRYEALLEAIHQKGWGDEGAGGSYRVVRVPGSANLKEGRGEFRSVITEWSPDLCWTLDGLAEAFGVDMDAVVVKDRSVSAAVGGASAMDNIDPLLDWLVAAGEVVSDGGGWVDVVCPWASRHTSGSGTAGYSPLGRGDGKFVQMRGFKCQHEHCKDNGLRAFIEHHAPAGAPQVSGFDPLPWLQDTYVYIESGQMVADMHQRVLGGTWLWEWGDFVKKYPGRVTVAGHDRPILVANAFLEHDATTRAVDQKYLPVPRGAALSGLATDKGQVYVNTYKQPTWEETDRTPEIFLDHLAYLVPDELERETVLSWLAYKIQHPDRRSFCVLMVADGAYGTGRSWLKDMLAETLQGGVSSASLGQLIGKGTSAEQTYNDWMAGCQFVVVEEARDNSITTEDFYHGFETFKEIVDTKVGHDRRINPKYGRTRFENVYFNALIFSNHADALAIPAGDRRVMVVENPSERLDYDYYERLHGALGTGQEAAALYWWLMRRSLQGFDHVYPPETEGKAAMIQDNEAPSVTVLHWLAENHVSDLVTRDTLKDGIVRAAVELGMDKYIREPGILLKTIWRSLKTLRPGDRNGARLVVGGRQTEVRAVRNREDWRGKMALGTTDAANVELNIVRGANIVELNTG